MGNNSTHNKNWRNGFTIVELLIVVVVIAILAAITLVSYNGIATQARDSQIRSIASQASKEIGLYTVTASNNPYPVAGSTLKACQNQTVLCDYTRNDYVDVESGEQVWAYALLVCDTSGNVQYAVSNNQQTPRKVLSNIELTPRINNQYNLFTANGMSVYTSGAPGSQYGQIYAYTGQTVAMSVALRPCTAASKTSFQWQSRNNSSAAWANISGATSSNYTTPTLNSSYDGRQYRVNLTNQYGTTNSGYGAMIMDFEP